METKKRRSDRCTRLRLRSPGRPPVANRHERGMFWKYIATGMSSEAAEVKAGASQPVGSRWFRGGGDATSEIQAFGEAFVGQVSVTGGTRRNRVVIGSGAWRVQDRTPAQSSNLDGIPRNAATRSGNFEYRTTSAQWHADRAARRPKIAKLAANSALSRWVDERLNGGIAKPGDLPATGPSVSWKGRRRGPPEPALVKGMEPGADCQAATHRLSG
jgi:hypothetical protein